VQAVDVKYTIYGCKTTCSGKACDKTDLKGCSRVAPVDGSIDTNDPSKCGTYSYWELWYIDAGGTVYIGKYPTFQTPGTAYDTFRLKNTFPVSCGSYQQIGSAFFFPGKQPPGGWGEWTTSLPLTFGAAARLGTLKDDTETLLSGLQSDSDTADNVLRILNYDWDCCDPNDPYDTGTVSVYANGKKLK
jgi:hypothetical protein